MPGAGWGVEPTPLRLAVFPSGTCLYSSSMVVFVWWLFAVRCNKVLVTNMGWGRAGTRSLAWKRGQEVDGLSWAAQHLPHTQGMTSANLPGYFKQGHPFFSFFFSFSETHVRVVP